MKLHRLQGLRAIAAILVVISHSLTMIPAAAIGGADLRPIAWYLGEQGVATFFVISGFIMAYRVREPRTPRNAARFFIDRVRRIVPLYWSFSLLAAALIVSGLWLKGKSITVIDLILSLFFIPYADGSAPMRPVLGQGWTLNYEMGFYALFGLSLLLPAKAGSRMIIAVLLGLTGLGFLFGPTFTGDEPNTLFEFWTAPHLALFAAGIGLAALKRHNRIPQFTHAYSIVAVSILLSLLTFLTLHNTTLMPAQFRTLYWLFDIAMVAACVASGQQDPRIPADRIMEYLGDASYSIYLAHGFALSIAAKLYGMITGWGFPILFVPLAVASGLAGGIVSYELIERRLLASKRLPTPTRWAA